jgi:hypothetical protein
MGVPTSEVGYTSATTGRGDHKVHKGHEVALENNNTLLYLVLPSGSQMQFQIHMRNGKNN